MARAVLMTKQTENFVFAHARVWANGNTSGNMSLYGTFASTIEFHTQQQPPAHSGQAIF